MIQKVAALLVLPILLFSGCSDESGDTENELNTLNNRIRQTLEEVDGDFAVVFKDVSDSGAIVMINENELFHAASTMKTPVMIELYRQAENGQLSLDDSVLVKNEFRSIIDSSRYKMDISEDSEAELYDVVGQQRPIRLLIDDMITKSSNLATNILIEMVGGDQVTQTMRRYGADSIQVLRGVEDLKAYEQGLSNRTTAACEAIIYERLATHSAVSSKASEEMIEILSQQTFNEMIPARLPEEVAVAHKTGWITGVNHDAGIVMLPDGRRYVLVLLSKNAQNREAIHAAFAEVSRMAYEYMTTGA